MKNALILIENWPEVKEMNIIVDGELLTLEEVLFSLGYEVDYIDTEMAFEHAEDDEEAPF